MSKILVLLTFISFLTTFSQNRKYSYVKKVNGVVVESDSTNNLNDVIKKDVKINKSDIDLSLIEKEFGRLMNNYLDSIKKKKKNYNTCLFNMTNHHLNYLTKINFDRDYLIEKNKNHHYEDDPTFRSLKDRYLYFSKDDNPNLSLAEILSFNNVDTEDETELANNFLNSFLKSKPHKEIIDSNQYNYFLMKCGFDQSKHIIMVVCFSSETFN